MTLSEGGTVVDGKEEEQRHKSHGGEDGRRLQTKFSKAAFIFEKRTA